MQPLVIDRAQWATGKLRRVKREGSNYLRAGSDGRCCALGFYALDVLKLRPKAITDRSSLRGVLNNNHNPEDYSEARGLFVNANEMRIVSVNDDEKITAKDREVQLKTLFSDVLDVDLSFHGRLAR